MICFHFIVRQGSKYKDGQLVGVDKEIEITEWFSGDHKGHTVNEIDDRKGSNVLAVTDKTKSCKSLGSYTNHIVLLFASSIETNNYDSLIFITSHLITKMKCIKMN